MTRASCNTFALIQLSKCEPPRTNIQIDCGRPCPDITMARPSPSQYLLAGSYLTGS